MTYDSSSPKEVTEKAKASKAFDIRAKEGLKAIMGDPTGRTWLYRLLTLCDPYTNCFSSDPLHMAMRCGETNIGLQVIADMHEASPELYLLMMKENQ